MSLNPTPSKLFNAETGNQWLGSAASIDSAHPSESGSVVVIEIPDVKSVPVFGAKEEDCSEIAATLSRAMNESEHPVQYFESAQQHRTDREQEAERQLQAIRESMSLQTVAEVETVNKKVLSPGTSGAGALVVSADAGVSADISEKPTDWTEAKPDSGNSTRVSEVQEPQTSRSTADPSLEGTPAKDAAITTLVESILDRFPVGDPTVIVFVGSEENIHTDETCARVASELSNQNIGRIMLIDSDTKTQALTIASGLEGQPGLAEIVNFEKPWQDLVYGRSSSGLDFLAAGSGKFYHADRQERMRSAISAMKKEYQFVCVSAGDAHGKSAKIWNDICDGTYLLVSMKNTNETIAKSAVAELQSNGARLLGCVVTDAG